MPNKKRISSITMAHYRKMLSLMVQRPYSIKELSAATGVRAETVRRYISEISAKETGDHIIRSRNGRNKLYTIDKVGIKLGVDGLIDLLKHYAHDTCGFEQTSDQPTTIAPDGDKPKLAVNTGDFFSDLKRIGRAYVGGHLYISGINIGVDLTIDFKAQE